MRILLVPNLPRSVRELAHRLVPSGSSLAILAASDPRYPDALAEAECLMGLPRDRYDAAFFGRAPRLRLIQLLRAGHELIDLEAAAAAGVQVATVGEATSDSVAEHCLMLMLALCRKLRWQHDAVVTGGWLRAKPWQLPSGDVDSVPEIGFDGLSGRTLGILGLGAIGGRVARLARAFGMTVQALARTPGAAGPGEIPRVPLEVLLETADVLSLHLRLSAETRHLLGREALARVRRGAYLVNTARGALVDEVALDEALDRGQRAGAALDTLEKEPPRADHPLVGRADVLLTPHTAWLSSESWRRTLDFGVANVARFVAGEALRSAVGRRGG
jgi:phosphoglycerate dehydrogenase-like enzyme